MIWKGTELSKTGDKHLLLTRCGLDVSDVVFGASIVLVIAVAGIVQSLWWKLEPSVPLTVEWIDSKVHFVTRSMPCETYTRPDPWGNDWGETVRYRATASGEVAYSFGSNGIDELGSGDDVELRQPEDAAVLLCRTLQLNSMLVCACLTLVYIPARVLSPRKTLRGEAALSVLIALPGGCMFVLFGSWAWLPFEVSATSVFASVCGALGLVGFLVRLLGRHKPPPVRG